MGGTGGRLYKCVVVQLHKQPARDYTRSGGFLVRTLPRAPTLGSAFKAWPGMPFPNSRG